MFLMKQQQRFINTEYTDKLEKLLEAHRSQKFVEGYVLSWQ